MQTQREKQIYHLIFSTKAIPPNLIKCCQIFLHLFSFLFRLQIYLSKKTINLSFSPHWSLSLPGIPDSDGRPGRAVRVLEKFKANVSVNSFFKLLQMHDSQTETSFSARSAFSKLFYITFDHGHSERHIFYLQRLGPWMAWLQEIREFSVLIMALWGLPWWSNG